MKINTHTHHPTRSSEVIEVVNKYPSSQNDSSPHFSMGIHPWYIKNETVEQEMFLLEQMIQNDSCIAIGECGLDKKINVPLNIQVDVLKRQLLLAEKYKKAVILHVVSAYQEIIAVKKEMRLTVPLVVHGFNKNQQVADSLFKNGFYLSFGKSLLLNESLRNVFRNSPKNKVFLETDDTQDCKIEDIYDMAEKIVPSIESQIEQNFKNVFNK